MITFKVYFVINGKIDNIFVDAKNELQARWKTLSRFPGTHINRIIEV